MLAGAEWAGRVPADVSVKRRKGHLPCRRLVLASKERRATRTNLAFVNQELEFLFTLYEELRSKDRRRVILKL